MADPSPSRSTSPVDSPAFVHLDYFPGNVMAEGEQISAVIDFGYASIIGDRRMNALVATAHLITPRITPTVTDRDRDIAFAWLRERELFDYFERGLPWLAAYWTFAWDDVELFKMVADRFLEWTENGRADLQSGDENRRRRTPQGA